MGKAAGKGRLGLRRVGRRAGKAASTAHTRSFPCPDDLWDEVESFATEHELGSPAAAARLLLRSGLSVERRVRELKAARDWQIEQAWSDLQAVAGGDRTFGSPRTGLKSSSRTS